MGSNLLTLQSIEAPYRSSPGSTLRLGTFEDGSRKLLTLRDAGSPGSPGISCGLNRCLVFLGVNWCERLCIELYKHSIV